MAELIEEISRSLEQMRKEATNLAETLLQAQEGIEKNPMAFVVGIRPWSNRLDEVKMTITEPLDQAIDCAAKHFEKINRCNGVQGNWSVSALFAEKIEIPISGIHWRKFIPT